MEFTQIPTLASAEFNFASQILKKQKKQMKTQCSVNIKAKKAQKAHKNTAFRESMKAAISAQVR